MLKATQKSILTHSGLIPSRIDSTIGGGDHAIDFLLAFHALLATGALQALPLRQEFGTFLGGTAADLGQHVRADAQGIIMIAGLTSVGGIPVVNATPVGPARNERLFVAKFSTAGVLLWSNCYGGNNRELLHNLAVGCGVPGRDAGNGPRDTIADSRGW